MAFSHLFNRFYCKSTEKPDIKAPGRVKNYIFNKYMSYLERQTVKFQKKYPKVYKLYRLFKDGRGTQATYIIFI